MLLAACLYRQDEAWLEIHLHCTAKDATHREPTLAEPAQASHIHGSDRHQRAGHLADDTSSRAFAHSSHVGAADDKGQNALQSLLSGDDQRPHRPPLG